MARKYIRDSHGRFSSGGGVSVSRAKKNVSSRRATLDAANSNLRRRASAANKAIPKGKGPGESDARSAVARQLREDRKTLLGVRKDLGIVRKGRRRR